MNSNTSNITGKAAANIPSNEASITAALLRQQNEQIQQANLFAAAASVQPAAASRLLTTALPPTYLPAATATATPGVYCTADGLLCDYSRLPSLATMPLLASPGAAPPHAAATAAVLPPAIAPTAASNDAPAPQSEQPREGRVTFPLKLHQILWNDSISHIISWMSHGRAWKVHDQNKFEKEVMPKYFDMTKYSSFSRQVTGWGFHRINRGPDKGGYYHEKFLRGMPALSKTMRRKKNNPNKNIDDYNYSVGGELQLPAAVAAGPITAATASAAMDTSNKPAYVLNHMNVPQVQLPAGYGATFGLHPGAAATAAATNAIRLGALNAAQAQLHAHQARAYTGAATLGAIGAAPDAFGAIGVSDPDAYAAQRAVFHNTAAAPLGANTRMV
mmetsp:Transcript_6771/g.9919  ORF Transcript_6771/g.9919 Transcript_6771/m.9919 type:complete len:388 (-) Transcript_6771:140-1303(-)|eukprot:CAMPEP_0196816814 /NCGR_PEP_ID=MMETSP1362-20130617/57169_1 /TAXON_ID=163516 /ORGANISM="Leptocylindrus danicus, Strain CCMP1856" /LENGTH=387 /DNA_ID=CAMNT_0042194279 /DNA_START=134 /DNA_END=1297 /DNA_ORIENTATION=-